MSFTLLEQRVRTLEAGGTTASSDYLSVLPGSTPAQIQTRINDAVTLGRRRVHFNDGQWEFDCGAAATGGALIVVPSNFAVTGNGPGRSILHVTNTTTGVGAAGIGIFRTESDARRVVFEGLDFLGDNGVDEDGADFTYVLNNENCCIETYPGSIDTRDVTISRCMFRQTWGFAIHDRGGNFRTIVEDCTFLQCAGGANTNSDYGMVTNCRFERSEGIEASGKYSLYSNSVYKDCYGVAISAGGNVGGTEEPGSIVIGNTVDGCTGNGIVINDGFSFGVIANNVVRKCKLSGLVMYSSGGTRVRNNILTGNTFDSNCANPNLGVIIGCDIRGNDGGHQIFGNLFTDSGETGFSQQYGAQIDCANCIVAENRFSGTTVDCTFGPNATNLRLSGNYFVNNTEQFNAAATIAINKYLGINNTDRVWEHRIWNATTGAGRSLHAVDWNGKYFWGDGTNLEDTNLYRSAAGVLKTDGTFSCAALSTSSWTNITGQNSWVDNGSTTPVAGYRKLPDGTVECRGTLKSGTTTTGIQIFTFGAGNRPTGKQVFHGWSAGNNIALVVNSDGTVLAFGTISNTELTLDGIRFATT